MFGMSRDKKKVKQKDMFDCAISIAKDIAKQNPQALFDYLVALLKPLQAEHLLGVAERKMHEAPASLSDFNFFFDIAQIEKTKQQLIVEPLPKIELHLGRDIILPTSWERRRYVNALSLIGTGKRFGPWTQDSNHFIAVWRPWNIGFVTGGNHSITAGILANEGVVTACEVYDGRDLLSHVHSDGINYVASDDERIVSKVTDVRRAVVFEIGRLLPGEPSIES